MSDVVFRRVRGRIVPIKINKKEKDGLKGLGIAAAGAAVATGGASAYKRIVFQSTRLATRAFENLVPPPKQFAGMKHKFKSAAQMTFDDVIKQPVNTDKVFMAANKLSKLSSAVRIGSQVLGGALFYYGTKKALESRSKTENGRRISEAAAALGASSLPFAMDKAKKVFEFGLQNRQTKMAFAKSSVMDILKKHGAKVFGKAAF